MLITVNRYPSRNEATIGELYVDAEFECYTMEDQVREKKIKGETAIPFGAYQVVITHSPKFRRRLPLLVGVPRFSGVRIHPGNKARDTEGCILVGTSAMAGASAATNYVVNSQAAFDLLFDKIERAIDDGEDVTIELVEGVLA